MRTSTQAIRDSVMAVVCAALAGCASAPPPAAQPPAIPVPAPAPVAQAAEVAPPAAPEAPAEPHYRCDHDIEFQVRFGDGTAQIDAKGRESETLLRDAGGTDPQQTVYSSTNLRAEFGLGPNGREAVLHFASPALEAHCVRD